ncbi:HAD hydrolase-like protein [Qipengyuania gelatinilytica]|uniref:phosphoglycolate phosphatase n=1 Tax=Qipengyuania gelatinilytica TaxID=2867231 RepID=A0ABX9A0Y9_9SPHN|nr:HAD hydrolase-like protein [Qipengyuania gelatinilytica]QZD94940.1 HAD hydrolase-like protein [Qipengyuania gelatinilytica]
MTGFPFDIVAFDLDGTLLETHRDLGTAVNHALDIGGFDPVPIDSATDLIGGGAKIMLKQAIDMQGGLADDEFRKLYKEMLGYYSRNNAVHTRPYPHAVETLEALGGRGVRMAVVTNKFESFATDILQTLGLASRFEIIIGGDSLGKGPDGKHRAKPAPDPIWHAREACGGGTIAFVGDSSYDVKAARAAGVPVIAAAYGYCDAPAAELGADAAIDSLAALIPALERL